MYLIASHFLAFIGYDLMSTPSYPRELASHWQPQFIYPYLNY